jgi:hypothetical protein
MPESHPPPGQKSESSGVARIPTSSSGTEIDLEADDFLVDEERTLGETAIAKSQADANDVEITTGEADIFLDDLDLDEGDDPCPSPFERITVAPEVPEREYVARMMRAAPSSDPVPSQRPMTRPPATLANPAAAEELAREDAERVAESTEGASLLTLDLIESVLPPETSAGPEDPVSIPPPPSLPDEATTGIRGRAASVMEVIERADADLSFRQRAGSEPASYPSDPGNGPFADESTRGSANGAPLSFGPMSGDALELVGVRAQSVRPPPSIGITMRAVRDRFDVGDFSGALIIAEGILEHDPESVDALLYAEHCRDVLKQMYVSRLGGVGRVPQVAVSDEQLRWLSIDHRAGFLLSLVDGHSSFEEVLDMSGMPPIDALRLLLELLQQNVIKVA